jgi:hypothetical protein
MTMSPGDPGPTDVDETVAPPYEGRREAADVDGDEKMERDGATTAGATGPVESDRPKADERPGDG